MSLFPVSLFSYATNADPDEWTMILGLIESIVCVEMTIGAVHSVLPVNTRKLRDPVALARIIESSRIMLLSLSISLTLILLGNMSLP